MRVGLFFISLVCLILPQLCNAQEGRPNASQETILFSELLKEIVRARQKPMTFEMKFKCRQIVLGRLSEKDKNDNFGRIVDIEGVVLVDELSKQLYYERYSKLHDVLSDDERDSWQDYLNNNQPDLCRLITNGSQTMFYPKKDQIQVMELGNSALDLIRELPFDLEIYGLPLPSMLGKKTPLEKVVRELNDSMGSMECLKNTETGIAVLDLRNEIIKIDTKRGFWPIERQAIASELKNGQRVRYPVESQKIAIKDFKGSWLPSRVEVTVPAMSFSYEFEWIRYDEPLPKDAFSLQSIKNERWSGKSPEVGKKLRTQK